MIDNNVALAPDGTAEDEAEWRAFDALPAGIRAQMAAAIVNWEACSFEWAAHRLRARGKSERFVESRLLRKLTELEAQEQTRWRDKPTT